MVFGAQLQGRDTPALQTRYIVAHEIAFVRCSTANEGERPPVFGQGGLGDMLRRVAEVGAPGIR